MAISQEIQGRVFGGDFEVRRLLDEGGSGAVYLCWQRSLRREAVVKVLHRRLRNSDLYLGRFLREARLAAQLDHPYAAHVYQFSPVPEDGVLWIAMERVSGDTLHDWIRKHGPMPLDQFVQFFERIAEVVDAAHVQGIVHRDLKPSNIMVIDRAGRLLPKLLDFGLAKLFGDPDDDRQDLSVRRTPPEDALHALTYPGAMVGTPPYMPPEQWSEPAAVGPRSDLYALAVVAYEALTGRLPFLGASIPEYIHLHSHEPVPPVGERLPVALDRFFQRALAKVPEHRWESALDLAAALRIAATEGDADTLPQLDEALRNEWITRAPQPLAAGVADLVAARNAHHARDAVHELVRSLLCYLLAIALASWRPDESDDDPELLDLLRALRTRELGIAERVRLLRLLLRGRAKIEVPELLELVALGPDGTDQLEPFVALGASHTAASEAVARLRVGELHEHLTAALAACGFILEYAVVCSDGASTQAWRGVRPEPAPDHSPTGRPTLVDREGIPRLELWPAIQVRQVAEAVQLLPAADAPANELHVFEGCQGASARLVGASGRPLRDQEVGAWFAQLVSDVESRTRPQEQLRMDARHWHDNSRPRKLLLTKRRLRDAERLATPILKGEPVASFLSHSRREVVRTAWRKVAWTALGGLVVALAIACASLVRTHMAQEVVEEVTTKAAAAQGRQELLHDEVPDALVHLREAYDRGDRALSTRFMLARARQSERAEQATFPSSFGSMWSAAFSPDGSRVVTADDRNAQIWDASTHRLLFTLAHGDTVFQAVYSSDGATIATAGADGAVRLWRAIDGAPLQVLMQPRRDGKRTQYYSVAISSDCGSVAAIDTSAAIVNVWRLSTGAPLATLGSAGGQSPLLSFSPNSRWLAVGGGEKLRLFDTTNWAPVLEIGEQVRTVAFDPARARIVTGSSSGDISVWSIPDGRRLLHFRESGEAVTAMSYSPDGELLAVAGAAGGLQVWRHDQFLNQSNEMHDKILAVEFDSTSERLLIAGANGRVVVLDPVLGLPLTTLHGPAHAVRNAHFDRSSSRIVGSSWDGTARIWDARPTYRLFASAPISEGCDIVTAPELDARFIAMGCPGLPTRIWDSKHDRVVAALPTIAPDVATVARAFPAVASDGSLAAIATGDQVQIYSLPDGRLVHVTSHPAPVTSIAFSRSGHELVSGDTAGSVIVTRDMADVQLATGASVDVVGFVGDRVVIADITGKLRVVDVHGSVIAELISQARVMALRQLPDGERMITIPRYDESRLDPTLWDTARYRKVADLVGHVGRTFSARFTIDGGLIVSAGGDGTVRTWDSLSGAPRGVYRGSTRFLGDALITPDGSMIVAGGADGLLRFWETSTGNLLWRIRVHRTFVIGLQLDGDDIITRGFGGDVARWRLPNPDVVIASLPPQGAAQDVASRDMLGR